MSEVRIIVGDRGERHYLVDGGAIATEGDDQVARMAWIAMQIPLGASVAWIGGGFCIGPRLSMGRKQTVYEIEPALREFCPEGVEFVPGDWRDTISGKYDVIVFDLGGDVPRETLAKYLNPGGVLLPKE